MRSPRPVSTRNPPHSRSQLVGSIATAVIGAAHTRMPCSAQPVTRSATATPKMQLDGSSSVTSGDNTALSTLAECAQSSRAVSIQT